MVDVTEKPDVYREAEAEGIIKLKSETIDRIFKGMVEKGDVLTVAKVAAIQAIKKTSEIIPLCHNIPITGAEVFIEKASNEEVKVRVRVRTNAKTGVEMEALTGVAVALLSIWDMVKKYEKNADGSYPYTEIKSIKVTYKVKK
uniref:Cyclic pyranopterin monophosphate synthase MoaC n=1 Tax=Staphylothermus marinus TaxID=2280 RepID=A0A7C4JMQ1_STAMA